MTISNLPRDLLVEIISRVPLRDMKAVRLTCKTWNKLSKTKSFTKLRVGKAKTSGTMMISMRFDDPDLPRRLKAKLSLISAVTDNVDPSIKTTGKLSLHHEIVNINFTRVFHYEGLLLCLLRGNTEVLVWNPYLGQTRTIRLRDYPHLPFMFNYALGYEVKKSRNNLKMLRFTDYLCETQRERRCHMYEMYDFDSGLWTTFDVTPNWSISCLSNNVSLKGNAYWCVTKKSSESRLGHIICFDFTRERFGPLLPLPVMDHHDDDDHYLCVKLSCVKEEKLAVLYKSYSDECEIWITTKIEAEMMSWSKFLKIDTGPKIVINYFIDEEKKVLMAFDSSYNKFCYHKTFLTIIGEAGHSKRNLRLPLPSCPNIWPDLLLFYVPSTTQIKQPTQGKGKGKAVLKRRRHVETWLHLKRNKA